MSARSEVFGDNIRQVSRQMHEPSYIDDPVFSNPVDVAMRRLDARLGDAEDPDVKPKRRLDLSDGRMLPERETRFHDEAFVDRYLPLAELRPRARECFVDVVLDARMKPDRPHSPMCFSARSRTA